MKNTHKILLKYLEKRIDIENNIDIELDNKAKFIIIINMVIYWIALNSNIRLLEYNQIMAVISLLILNSICSALMILKPRDYKVIDLGSITESQLEDIGDKFSEHMCIILIQSIQSNRVTTDIKMRWYKVSLVSLVINLLAVSILIII